MGYRSDVLVMVASSDEEVLERSLALWLTTDEYQESLEVCDNMFEGSKRKVREVSGDKLHCIEWHMKSVKWYPRYKDVEAFGKLLSLIGEVGEDTESNEGDKVGVVFARIGEEDSDTELYFLGNHYIQSKLEWIVSITRNIEVSET